MKMVQRKKQIRRNRKQGLILLIVLGMLAMFTLLAVTYVVTAGSSRQGSLALAVRARNSNLSITGTARNVLKDALRGTNNQKSPFYNTSLIGDVFGPNPIRAQFGPYLSANSARRFFGIGVNLVKLSVTRNAQLNGPLSDLENEYNSRIITILEGPLNGQSFRILKYVGFVRGGNQSGLAQDPNIDQTFWSDQGYTDPLATDTEYSILIDLNEVIGSEFTGEYIDTNGSTKSISLSVNKWISTFGISSLFYFQSTTTGSTIGYKFLINDAPFNSPGIGLEDIAVNGVIDPVSTPLGVVPGYGNIDSQRLLKTSRKVPPALLTHYDFLQDPNIMAVNPADGTIGVDGIGVTTRNWTLPTASMQFALNGSSNEGYDVPGYQDPWLAHQSFAGGQYTIKPSYHDPAVANYISNLYDATTALAPTDLQELVRLIDASSARVLSYPGKNTGFRLNDGTNVSRLSSYTTANVQKWVKEQILGGWDVDNDGDGIADSVWIDPGMQVVFAPDGRRLRPLAAVLIEDLDGRVNLNTSGDRVQGNVGYNAALNVGFDVTTNAYYKRPNQMIPQGFGYGPAEISLTALFAGNGNLLMSGPDFSTNPVGSNRFSFFDELTGARRNAPSRIIFPFVNDRVPGIPRMAVYPDPSFSALSEREFHQIISPSFFPRIGIPMSRRGTFGMSYDRNGNPAFVNPVIVDGDPYNAGTNAVADETRNDKYESAAMENPISDDPLGLHDLETILRRFDEDAQSLPPRLRDKLTQISGYNIRDAVNREVTVRSGELRYPNLATAMKIAATSTDLTIAGQAPGTATPSYLRYIRMLHSQRYRNQSFPQAATDDHEIPYATLAELFPVDFAKGLRMDLNRPFGDGYDDDFDGQIDEPNELEYLAQQERFPALGYTLTNGAYSREIKPNARKTGATIAENATPFRSETRRRLGSRQILARNLYCLAQLIIPRSYDFPGMETSANALSRARIRATAIAQWAVNVVDFRDSDAAMTRFEFDILPFGSNKGLAANFGSKPNLPGPTGLPDKYAYWAPDRIEHANNKQYVGVVWGMEMPELLMTETLAMHDKMLRDTDMDTSGKTCGAGGDPDLDQWRFPLASLFIELYNPRTAAGANALVPGAPSSLYNNNQLQLDKLAPFIPTWGRQPIWRIAISEMYPVNSTDHPQDKLKKTNNTTRTFETVTHQRSTEKVPGGQTSDTVLAGASDLANTNTPLQFIEQYIGTDLQYDLAKQNPVPPIPSPNGNGFERFIWFANHQLSVPAIPFPPAIPDILLATRTAGREAESVYMASTTGAFLAGGSYLVIGPRAQTSIGSLTHNQLTGVAYPPVLTKVLMSNPTSTVRPILSPSYQGISFAGSSINTTLINNVSANQPWLSRIKTPQSLICSTPAPTANNWRTAFPGGIGINISLPAPVDGQSVWLPANVPTSRFNATDPGTAALPPDSWIDVSTGTLDKLPDTPFDYSNEMLPNKLKTGTYENVRAAYLQRLADPDFAYDPVTNPYITVDWMSIDLTVFNGEAPLPPATPSDPPVPGSDPKDIAPRNPIQFQARYKNGVLSPLAAANKVSRKGVSYHSPMTEPLRTTALQTSLPPTIVVAGITPPVNPEPYFPYQLGYEKTGYTGNVGNSATTLGYCNAGYFTGGSLPTPAEMNDTTNSNWTQFDGFGPPRYDTTAPVAFQGAPLGLAGVTWFNRPFASPYELMMVPLTGPGLFGLHHSAGTTVQDREMNGFVPSYQTTNAWNVNLRHDDAMLAPAAQTSLNSYWAKPEDLPVPPTSTRLADWPLLLEFVETQPPFIDANKFYRPDTMLGLSTITLPPPAWPTPGAVDFVAARFLDSFLPAGYTRPESSDPAHSEPATSRGPSLLAPYNMKPSYVAGGKINLNTIAFDSAGHSRALKAIEHNYLAGERGSVLDSLATNFSTSRQGYATATGNAFFNGAVVHPALDANFPTRFVGAYRPAMSSNLAPALANPMANQKMRSRYGVETSLLRSLDPTTNTIDQGTLQSNTADRSMLFQATPAIQIGDELEATQPFVRMQRAMRLPNLVTNQSNVFAVWVTVSLYEYDPISGFGNEYIGDTGLPERERQFFIIDRTIPVGFKPGEDLNTDRTILMQRKLP